MPAVALLLAAALQQPDTFVTDGAGMPAPYNRAHYEIAATLNEEEQRLEGHARVVYVNARPDTLHELYLHQYLNAFRPASKWSAADEREGRVRFQHLAEPDYGYERFSARPTVNGDPVRVEYPGAPDSTVARFVLERPILPGDTAHLVMHWTARPSTTPRRQGRRGRSWDFAQWYPKLAVHDRGGWEPNALIPAGELYGEFGDFDVVLVLREDQVVGATGVVTAGDPGWTRVARGGTPWIGSPAGPSPARSLSDITVVPPGYRAVRFRADDVHHFAFSVSPDYRYEGGTHVRRPSGTVLPRSPGMRADRQQSWDTVAIHVLYRPGDERQWGSGAAVGRTRVALEWLERIYGPYAYPQVTNLHRLDGGGTEFPMMMMNGSASQGLILHEGGHIYTYGILANNEWRSGWMDEGLTSYQTSWAQGTTPQDRAAGGGHDSVARAIGWRRRARRASAVDAKQIGQYRLDLLGVAQPIGTRADRFREFGVYNDMIYTRAELMYGALRDTMGDSAFTRFMREYYRDWRLLHVDERAMRTTAERSHSAPLGWFFDQWVRRTGLVDYALAGVETTRRGDGVWSTRARVVRRGEYVHPMPVGVQTSRGWEIRRASALLDDQWVEIMTAERPRAVRLDPMRTTEDWDRRNDVASGWRPRLAPGLATRRFAPELPFLDQQDRDRTLVTFAPLLWTSRAHAVVIGARVRSSYQGLVDRRELGVAWAVRARPVSAVDSVAGRWGSGGTAYTPALPRLGIAALPIKRVRHPGALERLQSYGSVESPRLPFAERPLIGVRLSAFSLDGVGGGELSRTWDASRFHFARAATGAVTRTLGATLIVPQGFGYLPARWEYAGTAEVRYAESARARRGTVRTSYSVAAGRRTSRAGAIGGAVAGGAFYGRGELALQFVRLGADSSHGGYVRLYSGIATKEAPLQRRIYASSQDPYETFSSNLVRPAGGILSQPDAHHVPLGGAGIRAYDQRLAVREVTALNAEYGRRLGVVRRSPRPLALWATAWGDVGTPGIARHGGATLADAGLGLSLRGWLYDRDVRLRVDAPLFVSQPEKAVGDDTPDGRRAALRWQFSLSDLW